jgi:hypothetical protein
MVHRHERQARGRGQCLGRRETHEQRADQPRPGGRGDECDVAQPRPRAGERVVHDRVDQLQVMARRDLGHHSAVALVEARLGGDDVAEHPPVARDDRRAGVVARGLEREDQVRPRGYAWTSVRHMMRASSLLSW